MISSKNKALIEKIKRIALKCRIDIEDLRDKNTNFWDADLSGMCGIASQNLYSELTKNGIKCSIKLNKYHYFILVNLYENRKCIVDITATQFSVKNPIVLILMDDNKLYNTGVWRTDE